MRSSVKSHWSSIKPANELELEGLVDILGFIVVAQHVSGKDKSQLGRPAARVTLGKAGWTVRSQIKTRIE